MAAISPKKLANLSPAVVAGIATLLLIWQGMLPRENFVQWIIIVGLFAASLLLLGILIADKPRQFWWWGMLLRVGALCYFPNLSDDYLRFLFDGHVSLAGNSPFAHLPAEGLSSPYPTMDYLLSAKNYYSVYPPVAQGLFAIAAYLGGSLWSEVLVLKVLWLAGEGVTLHLLPKLAAAYGIDVRKTLWYTLHPLVIIEGVGNLHLETWAALAMTGMLIAVASNKNMWAAGWLALGVMVKLVPLLAIPLVTAKTKKLRIAGLAALLIGIAWIPQGNWQYAGHVLESLQLYFHTFSFHASLYYLLSPLIGSSSAVTWLSFLFATCYIFLLIGLWRNRITLSSALMYAFSLYLLTATTVNPWYLIPILALQVINQQKWVFLWSMLIFLSYHAFRQFPYQEDLNLVALAYLPVYLLISLQAIQYVRSRYTRSHPVESQT